MYSCCKNNNGQKHCELLEPWGPDCQTNCNHGRLEKKAMEGTADSESEMETSQEQQDLREGVGFNGYTFNGS